MGVVCVKVRKKFSFGRDEKMRKGNGTWNSGGKRLEIDDARLKTIRLC